MPEIYDPILDAETDPDQPLKSSLAKRWAKNHIAVAQGALNGPVTAAGWHPYNKVLINDAFDGKFYDFAVDGAVTNFVTPDFLDGYEYRVRLYGISSNSASASLPFRFETYLETDAAYTGLATIATSTAATDQISGELEFLDVRRAQREQITKWLTANTAPGGIAAGLVGGSVSVRNAQKTLRARFSFGLSASVDAGQAFLDRRLAIY